MKRKIIAYKDYYQKFFDALKLKAEYEERKEQGDI
jgi:hypothetical protein